MNLTPEKSEYPYSVHNLVFKLATREPVNGLVIVPVTDRYHQPVWTEDSDKNLFVDFYCDGWKRAIVTDITAFVHECKTELVAADIRESIKRHKFSFAMTRPDAVWEVRKSRAYTRAQIDFALCTPHQQKRTYKFKIEHTIGTDTYGLHYWKENCKMIGNNFVLLSPRQYDRFVEWSRHKFVIENIPEHARLHKNVIEIFGIRQE